MTRLNLRAQTAVIQAMQLGRWASHTPQKMTAYKPNPHPTLVLYMGRKAAAAELFGKSFGKWLTQSFKSPEAIAGMAWGNLKAGKPPKSNWQRTKKGCCCCSGTRSAVFTYAPTSGDDDW